MDQLYSKNKLYTYSYKPLEQNPLKALAIDEEELSVHKIEAALSL